MSNDLRVVKTRHNIRAHFIDLLERQSFRDITIKQITEACQINRSTFYRNYTDKYDLMRDIMADVIDGFVDAIDPSFILLSQNDATVLRRCLEPLLDYFERNKRMLLIIYRSDLPVSISDELLSSFSKRLRNVMVDRLYERDDVLNTAHRRTSRVPLPERHDEPSPHIQHPSFQHRLERQIAIASGLSQIIASGILTAIKWWHMENPDMSRDELMQIMLMSFTDGIVAAMHELLDTPRPASA